MKPVCPALSYFSKTPVSGQFPSRMDSNMWYNVLSDSYGEFWMELANYRRYDRSTIWYSPDWFSLHLHILGPNQETLRDSILLTAPESGIQLLGTFEVP